MIQDETSTLPYYYSDPFSFFLSFPFSLFFKKKKNFLYSLCVIAIYIHFVDKNRPVCYKHYMYHVCVCAYITAAEGTALPLQKVRHYEVTVFFCTLPITIR